VVPREVEGDNEEKRPGPPVDGVEGQAFAVADEVTYEPDDEPEQGHVRTSWSLRKALARVILPDL
jgi:hypothetical protein